MRFLHYLQPDVSKEINTFRSMCIKSVVDSVDYGCVIEKIYEEYELSVDINDTINTLNKELKTIYNGKYKFALCVNEGIEIDKVKINKKHTTRIKMLLFSADDTLAKLKTEVEKKIKYDNH